MYLQHIFASAANLGLSVEASFLIAIAALACLFGAEVAGICILIRKMQHARRDKQQDELETEIHSRHESTHSHNYAIVALSFGAIPLATQVAFFTLAVLAAVGALVFAVVLIVFLANGYTLVSRASMKKTVEENAAEADASAEEIAPEAVLYATVEDGEEQMQETYVAEDAYTEETYYNDGDEEEPVIVEESAEDAPVTVIPRSEPKVGQAPAAGAIPVYSSAYPAGQMPYVEKYISETYKEVIKETTTTTTTPATEELLKAIAELMKISSQIRADHEMAVESPAAQHDDSVPTFADAEDEDEEMDDEDELDVEGGAQKEDDEDDEYESDLFSGNERIVGFDEETGCYIVAHYRKSFEAKLIQSRRSVKKYYSAIKNALLAYEGTKDRITWSINNYNNEHTQIAKINVRTRTLDLYLALDPATLEDSVYHGRDVSDKKKYSETPFLYKVNSPRKLTLALELVQRACEEQGLSPIDIETVNYEEQYPFDTTENLVSRGLIREYLREEKPAVTFELDPDHVPQVPEEDGSVIPANANFTWEFDNDQPEKVEETPIEEVAEVAPVSETPISVETTSGTTTTTHETVKTTERHYTERYYGTPSQVQYQAQLSTETQPIEALAVPTDASVDEQSESAEEIVIAEVPVEEAASEEIAEEAAEEATEEATEATVEETDPEDIFVWESLEDSASDNAESEEAYEEAEEEAYEETEEEVYEETEEEYEETEEEAYEETEEEYEETEEEAYEETEEEAYEETEEEAYEETEEEAYEETEEEAYEETEEEAYEETEEEAYEEAEEEAYEETEEEYEEEIEQEDEDEFETPVPQPVQNSNSSVALLDVCLFDQYFENGAIVNLETLKDVGLVDENATTLKVYASGAIKGQFTVEANHFTLDAIKAIGDADGDSIMIR